MLTYKYIIHIFIFSILISMPFSLQAQSRREESVIFRDDFNRNTNAWKESNDADARLKVEDGYYILDHKKDDGSYEVWKQMDLSDNDDFTIECALKHTAGEDNYGYGLTWGRKDNDNFFTFDISDNGYYRYSKSEKGEWTNIVDWATSDHIYKGNGYNILQVSKKGSTLEFFINGYSVTTATASNFFGKTVGFVVWKQQRVDVDYLKISSTGGGGGNIIFADDFSDNSHSWSTVNDEKRALNVHYGVYDFNQKNPDASWASGQYVNLTEDDDFTMEASVHHISGVENQGFGLVWGMKDVYNYYAFFITENGYYSVKRMDNNAWYDVIEWKTSSLIKTSNRVNLLKFTKVGNQIEFFINGTSVDNATSKAFFGKNFGVYVSDKQEVEFDDFKISRPSKNSGLNVLFSDNFSDNSHHWSVVDNDSRAMGVDGGVYDFNQKEADVSWASGQNVDLTDNDDFEMEATAKHISGVEDHGFGVVWGMKDVYNYYAFFITENGYYSVKRMDNNNWYEIIDWKTSDLVKRYGTVNRLKVKKSGSQLEFSLNGTVVDNATSQTFFGNNFGFYVSNKQHVEFDDFKISSNKKVSTIVETTNQDDGGTVVFFDDFNSNSKDWTTIDNDERIMEVNDGSYRVELKTDDYSWATWNYAPVTDDDDFLLETTLRHVDGANDHQFGVAWGVKDVHNYYTFCISDNGFYSLKKIDDNTWTNLIEWTASEYIYQDNVANRLAVRKIGSTVELIINDKTVNTAYVGKFFGNNVGFSVSNKQRFDVDNIKITKLSKSSTSQYVSYVEEKPKQKEVEEQKDVSPPVVTITQPAVSRGMKLTQKEKTITIKGNATDESGVYEVKINGVEASLGENGDFLAEVKLAVGENKIKVQATDTKNNSGEQIISIVRESAPLLQTNVTSRETETNTTTNNSAVEGKYFALIIAIQDYKDPSINSLDFPIKDATRLVDVLTSDYIFDNSDVTFLKNPDRKSIIQTLSSLKNKLTPEDNLLIFYAGHGYWDEDLQQGYWLPANSTANDPSEWLPNSTVRDYIRGIKTKHTFLVADACFGGGIFKGRDAFIKADISVQETYKVPSRRAMTSGALKTVPDKSVFVEYLVKRLKENSEKYLYAQKLFVNLKEAVMNNSPNRQTPLYGIIQETGDEGIGDFIFVKK